MNKTPEITVKTYKYDGKLHRSWKAGLIDRQDNLLVMLGVFDQAIEHSHLGVIHSGTLSYEYYWLDRWYNIFRFHEPDGSFRNYYCNVNMPPRLEGDVLSYVDLDIDVFISKDLEVAIWDVDEFNENAERYKYPADVMNNAQAALSKLLHLIEGRAFPFNEVVP